MSDRLIQTWLDAVADQSVVCQGNVVSVSVSVRSMLGPIPPHNCEKRHQCPLFNRLRQPENVRLWHETRSRDGTGCEGYVLWQREKDRQDRESREWIVTMAGQTRLVTGADPSGASVGMWILLREEGLLVDKMVLFNKEYSVREA